MAEFRNRIRDLGKLFSKGLAQISQRIHRRPSPRRPEELEPEPEVESEKCIVMNGSGMTTQDPVVIRGAGFDLIGTYAEFEWLKSAFGEQGRNWELIRHSHGHMEGKEIDTVVIRVREGKEVVRCFDITESLGKPFEI